MEAKGNAYRVLGRKPEGKRALEDLEIDTWAILKWILNKQDFRVWTRFMCFRVSGKYRNQKKKKNSCSTKSENFMSRWEAVRFLWRTLLQVPYYSTSFLRTWIFDQPKPHFSSAFEITFRSERHNLFVCFEITWWYRLRVFWDVTPCTFQKMAILMSR